ncbi:hypothetical protein PFICI_01273 [Pestalotiopsis fici W106-1]|uniref:Uncharacterized protein n=1 Tax=Pestalotiopsis fici (strain W106-1 / CGMCC3.15140) TaxID=1229662 RepID=W3XNC1_PESFW|nr:uncharacterized protein PFICI_01273 [Pestalotiopsis fici W106-1]ETS87445.1 hypothetical protein PFICI_01273 [Pestalotiopsis fici W106-1]
MEEFRSMAQEICFRSSFPRSPREYVCYSLTEESMSESHEEDLAVFFSSVDQAPTLRLGLIPTDEHRRPCISGAALRSLWAPDVAGFDDGALWLLHHKYDGYHHFPGDGEIETFFFGYSRQAIIWTYNRRTLSTRAMLVARLPNLSPSRLAAEISERAQSLLLLVLERHARHVSSPNFMGYTFAVSVCFLYDHYDNQHELAQIQEIEAATGFQWLGTPLREGFSIDQITKWLQISGQVLIAYSGRKRSLGAIESLLDHLNSELDDEYLSPCETALRNHAMDSRHHLSEAIPQLRRRIHAYDKYMDYMTFRVERLSSVVNTNPVIQTWT